MASQTPFLKGFEMRTVRKVDLINKGLKRFLDKLENLSSYCLKGRPDE